MWPSDPSSPPAVPFRGSVPHIEPACSTHPASPVLRIELVTATLTVAAKAERGVGDWSNVWEGREGGPTRARAMGERETDDFA